MPDDPFGRPEETVPALPVADVPAPDGTHRSKWLRPALAVAGVVAVAAVDIATSGGFVWIVGGAVLIAAVVIYVVFARATRTIRGDAAQIAQVLESTIVPAGAADPAATTAAFQQLSTLIANAQAKGGATPTVIDAREVPGLRDAMMGMLSARGIDVAHAAAAAHPAIPAVQPTPDPADKLLKLKHLLDAGLITDADFASQKKRLLEQL
ncbi:MAG: hypothetical protein QOE65_1873 [Solirubrobacteraceae bacterium]|jgi:hypothetical protein|nr:hypothetical protein [Solirubrobacteraceae bacterium]